MNNQNIFDISDELDENEIISRLRNKNLNYDVVFKKSTGSTNDDAKKINGKNNLLIVAETQAAGKGRYGRDFYSENNRGLYFTLKINNHGAPGASRPTSLNIDDITFIPLISAVAASRAVSSVCGIDLAIKWPNDLLYKTGSGYKKVCGILTEAAIETASRNAAYIISGIGLNVNNDPDDFPDDIKNTAASLKIISGKKYARADILCETVNEFTQLLHIPRGQLLDEYKKRLLLDINISFSQDGAILKGKAKGINESGNLIAALENGEEITIQSGEVNFI